MTEIIHQEISCPASAEVAAPQAQASYDAELDKRSRKIPDMPIKKHLLVVSVSVKPQVEEAWNRWYNDEHLPDIAGCAGFVSAQRYVSSTETGRRYLTIYELSGPDALKSKEFIARRGWGPFINDVHFETCHYERIFSAQENG